MAIVKSDILRATLQAHGIKPYNLKLEVASEPSANYAQSFPNLNWIERPAKVDSLIVSYGSSPDQVLTFTTWDPQSVDAEHMISPVTTLKVPQNGDFVLLTVTDSTTDNNGRVLFRGQVRSVNEQVTDAGIVYHVEALSEVTRLNDSNCTFEANPYNDPINPTPHFDNENNVYVNRLKTVVEIAQDIMNFSDTWQTNEFFQYTDIDWNGLDTDPRLGMYIPPGISIDGKKGDALETLLSTAGNFTFLYVPQRTGRGVLRVVELNLQCNACGDIWNINWAPTTAAAQILIANYAFNHVVVEDATEWNTRDTANVIRISSKPIRFYSGNWFIPEILDGDNLINCGAIDQDTIQAQQKRAVGLDFANYRFTAPTDLTNDVRQKKWYPVGLPLFPDWDIHSDYLPAWLEIQDAQIPAGTTVNNGNNQQMTDALYRGLVEFKTYTIGDEVARGGGVHLKYINNLRVYQAFHVEKACPACTPSNWPPNAPGPGLVDRVYSGANNEPVLLWEAVSPTGRRTVQPTDTLNAGERLIFTVTNYIMNPANFGDGSPPPAGLVPWTGLNNPSDYPLPWQHLCPYCRGTGWKPEYKLRMIEGVLYEGRNNQVHNLNGVTEVPIDADFTQTQPESWDQTQSRYSMHQGPFVQIETSYLRPYMPQFQYRNKKFSDIAALSNDQQTNLFANPLSFVALTKRLPLMMGVAPTSPAAQIVPSTDDWKCRVPFTTIVMGATDARMDMEIGRVLFDEPQFVACVKAFSDYVQIKVGQFLITNGQLTPTTLGRGQITASRSFAPTGFWRHARAWMTFYYTRPLYYNYLFTDAKGNQIDTTTFTAEDPEGNETTYLARAAIHNGRLVIEVKKQWPGATEAGGTAFQTGNRVLQQAISDDNAWIETTVDDLFTMPIPPQVDVSPADLESFKATVTPPLNYVRARILKFEPTTPGEKQAEMEGYITADYAASIMRPKLFSWRLRDDRPRLLGRAVRALEWANNIVVQGSLILVGMSHEMSRGLGFVNKPNKGLAAVKRVVYTFSEGLVAELDVRREEARMGEPRLTDQERMHAVEKNVLAQRRTVDTLRAIQQQQASNAALANQFDQLSAAAANLYKGA